MIWINLACMLLIGLVYGVLCFVAGRLYERLHNLQQWVKILREGADDG